MNNLEEDTLQFLDLSDIPADERDRVLSSLRCSDSNIKLPWIITRTVPSRTTKTKQQKKEVTQQQPVFLNHTTNQPFVNQHYDQTIFQPSYPSPTYSVSPTPYTVAYPIPIPGVYSYLGTPPSTIVTSPVIYSGNHPAYSYSQVQNVPVNIPFNNVSPYSPYDALSVATNNLSLQENNVSQSANVDPVTKSDCNVSNECLFTADNNDPSLVDNPVLYQATPVSHNNNFKPSLTSNCALPNVSYGVPSNSPFSNINISNKPTEASAALTDVHDGSLLNRDSNLEVKETQNGSLTENSPANKSWASLFNKSRSSQDGSLNNSLKSANASLNQSVNDTENNNSICPIKNPKRAKFIDPTCYRLAEYLMEHTVDGRAISLQPRGLINRSNYCYINSILQALLACPPMYNLLSGLSKNITSNEKRKPTPVIDSVCRLINEFEQLPAGQRVGRRSDKNQKKEQGVSINCDSPFEPAWIYKVLNGMRTDSFLVEGRQEDAEEFFLCLLNGLNDEMGELIELVASNGEENVPEHDQDEWQVMGPKNKGSVTRKATFGKTPISEIFGGLLKSRIQRTGDEPTNNIQPFFSLQLNIENAKTVSEALENLVSKNQLEGVTSSKTNEEVEAWEQVTIEKLPIILVLHLKCFDYKIDGCTKIMKALEFPIDLKLDPKLLSQTFKTNTSKERQYKLFAVVYHDGKEASKGHYVTDAFHVGYNSWIRYDDSSVKAVLEEHVLTPQGSRVPYLLFYRRSDTIRSK